MTEERWQLSVLVWAIVNSFSTRRTPHTRVWKWVKPKGDDVEIPFTGSNWERLEQYKEHLKTNGTDRKPSHKLPS